jgi:hypothetical protein
MIFRATTGPGTPDSLVYVSGNYQLGRVNTALPQPFVVRITDANGIPVEGQDVEFEAISSGAHFPASQSERSRAMQTVWPRLSPRLARRLAITVYL